jgi:hypothetical protein
MGHVKRPSKLPQLLFLLIAVAAFSGRATAQTPTTFTISGTVTNNIGQPLADVAVILLSDAVGTQIVFTNQTGNYAINHPVGVTHNLRITPSKSGFVFDPLSVIFISTNPLSGDRTQSFVGTAIPIQLPFLQIPFLLTQENSLRSLALDSATHVTEPFGVTNINNFSTDQRTRLSLFAMNVELSQGEPLSVITAQAETPTSQVFLTVEFFGAVPNFPWLKQIVVKLPDAIANSDEVRVSLNVRGTASNKVLVKVKP